jgi:cell division protein FtsB
LIRVVALALALLLAGLQWRLWYSDSSLPLMWQKQARLAELVATQESLAERNRKLYAEVDDLKTGLGAVEARARLDLGLIGPNETFYQVIEDNPSSVITPAPLSSATGASGVANDRADAPADEAPSSDQSDPAPPAATQSNAVQSNAGKPRSVKPNSTMPNTAKP